MGPFFVPTAAIAVENTHNFAGGSVISIEDLRALKEYAVSAGAAVHMDGARIWNAHVATGTSRSEEHTSELQSLMRISYAVFCLQKQKKEFTTQVDMCIK